MSKVQIFHLAEALPLLFEESVLLRREAGRVLTHPCSTLSFAYWRRRRSWPESWTEEGSIRCIACMGCESSTHVVGLCPVRRAHFGAVCLEL